jgi:hypothetical protein
LQQYEKTIKGLQTGDQKIEVANHPLTKNKFLCGWMDVKAVLRIAYTN